MKNMNEKYNRNLFLAVDMYGCPNRCKHCWLGHMPNRKLESGADEWIVGYFKPYFDNIGYYSWLREPDFCEDYRERWLKDIELSIGIMPQRFELASFWRIVRDPQYITFLNEVGVKTVQLTFFGLEKMTDKYVGRSGAFKELLQATELLLEHEIAPRWQAFIYQENREELVALLELSKELKLKERCQTFGTEFNFFVHAGGCGGENRKQYDIWIEKDKIPKELMPYYLDYEELLSEKECYELLRADDTHHVPHNEDDIVVYIANNYDVFFNFTHMSREWKIGNLKMDEREDLIRRIVEEDIPALNLARTITMRELVDKYGNRESERAFCLSDYKDYLLDCYVRENLTE